MKKFLGKLGLIIVVLFGIQFVINMLFPYYYGNKDFIPKLKEFRSKKMYNAVCFGSSRMYRHLIPEIVNDSFPDLNLYNFGLPGAYNPESYYLYEKFIVNCDSGTIRIAFLELQELDTIPEHNLKSVRTSYWNTDLRYCLEYISDPNFDSRKRKIAYEQYLISYAYRWLNFSKVKFLRKYFFNHRIKGENGYLTLDDDSGENLLERQQELVTKPEALVNRRTISENFGMEKSSTVPNQAHLNKLQTLLDISQNKGIRLYFVISPRLGSYQGLMGLQNQFKDKTINLASSYRYPEFYDVANSFDLNHLNRKGAELFTIEFIEELKRHEKKY